MHQPSEHRTYTKRDLSAASERWYAQCSCGETSRSQTDHRSLKAWATGHRAGAFADVDWWRRTA